LKFGWWRELPNYEDAADSSNRVEARHYVADIEHAMRHPVRAVPQEDGTRVYLGPAMNAELLEVVTVLRPDGSELVVHAMKMRPKYATLLPRE
jgi:hypothetical protein